MAKKSKKIIPAPNDSFTWYLYWICERMDIFWRKYSGDRKPWTEDKILQNFKFTNVYRCLDRVSQYLLSHVIYNGKQYEPEDIFFRILLFKHFNKVETWELLEKEFGDITYETGLENIARFLDDCIDKGIAIYGNAYIINCFFYQYPEYAHIAGMSKHRAHFLIYEDEIFQNGHLYDFLEAKSLEELFGVFRKMKIYGDFTAQQYAIDLNYSTLFNFDENDFVITGPGSIRGIERTFEDARGCDYVGVIKWVHKNFEELMSHFEKETGMEFKPLPNRLPTLIDLQNCFCETDKFLRGMWIETPGVKVKGQRIKHTYLPNKERIEYVFPEKWGVIMPG